MADYIYGRPNGGSLSGGWELTGLMSNNGFNEGYRNTDNFDGLKIGIFSREVNGVTEYALVNRGTAGSVVQPNIVWTITGPRVSWELGSNWQDNAQQPFGNSQDMMDSIRLASEFVSNNPGIEITMIGHSKGGAEAAANAVATNTNAFVFNPATLNLSAYGLNSSKYTADMIAYVVEGDALNVVFGGVSRPIGELIMLDRQYDASRWRIFSRIGNLGHNHGMAAILTALDERYRFSNRGCE